MNFVMSSQLVHVNSNISKIQHISPSTDD